MAYDQLLADRIRITLKEQKTVFSEKEMMGGLAFMVDDKMCVGVIRDKLMARIGPENYESALKVKGASEMNFTGRAMKGYVFVAPEGLDMDVELEHWIKLCLAFNPFAKSSKKK